MNLSDDIHIYYLKHFNKLPQDKQFHFASRLAAWNGDQDAVIKLKQLRSYVLPDGLSGIASTLNVLITRPPEAKINAAELRAPYFTKYPDLRGLMFALFRVRHLLFIYNLDAREELLSIKSLDEIRALAKELMADQEAIKVLSTYAVNYLYLIERILFDDSGIMDVEVLYRLGGEYETKKQNQILLLVYLYTHCIIGESNFYQRRITKDISIYRLMLDKLESIISSNYDDINLDNKLEFLVCCKIIGFNTGLASKIQEECENSVSPEGTFLIDTRNRAGQSNKTSFADSEHRNVLYIMSRSSYNPS